MRSAQYCTSTVLLLLHKDASFGTLHQLSFEPGNGGHFFLVWLIVVIYKVLQETYNGADGFHFGSCIFTYYEHLSKMRDQSQIKKEVRQREVHGKPNQFLVDNDWTQVIHDQESDKSKGKVENLISYSGRHGEMYSFPVSHVFNHKNKFRSYY